MSGNDTTPVCENTDSEVNHDQTDAKPFSKSPGGQSAPKYSVGASPMDMGEFLSEDEYNMNHKKRGLAIIINNRTFHSKTNMPERHGTDVDAGTLYKNLMELEFDVHLFHNQKTQDMLDILKKAAAADHSDSDCFVCSILTHGEEGVIYGTDGTSTIEDIVEPFKGHNCVSLAGKPKLFFLQACRGSKLDHGTEVADAAGVGGANEGGIDMLDAVTVHRIPSEADFLMAYSVVPGYYSWRNSTNGSWFIQALSEVLAKHGKSMEILAIMTRVNRKVAYDFESNASKAYMSRKKQIPCITSMLTKDLFFRPKK